MVADGGMSFEMEKYFETLCRKTGEQVIRAQRILEFNPDHKVLSELEKEIEAHPEKAAKLVQVLYYQALLTAELTIDDPKEYSDLVCELIF
jgi:molecular chaperone HtpG